MNEKKERTQKKKKEFKKEDWNILMNKIGEF